MSKHKMCKSEITYNEEQHSVYGVKFYVMQKQINKLEDFSEQLMEERNIYKNIVNELKELLSNPYNQDCIVQNNDFLNKIFELEKK